MQEYITLEAANVDLWNMKDGSQRWEVFRIGTQAHGVLRFNGAQQLAAGNATMVRFRAGGELPHTVIDLSSTYADQVARVFRGVALSKSGSVLIQDEWTTGDAPATVRWQIITEAEISVDGATVTLSQEGKKFRAESAGAGRGEDRGRGCFKTAAAFRCAKSAYPRDRI